MHSSDSGRSRITRRDFLKAGLLGGGATAVAATLGQDDARREHAGPGVGLFIGGGRAALLGTEGENLHCRVVVVEDLALGRLPEQFVPGRDERRQGVAHELPLRGGRQRDAQPPL